jgi:hypothetical protein
VSINAYKPHLLVLPEDDANRQIALGFALNQHINLRTIQTLPVAKGWGKVVGKFNSDYAPRMRQFPERRIVLLMDFDDKPENRNRFVDREIPEELNDRVFVLGVLSEPEKLKAASGKSFEVIGKTLAQDCYENRQDFWQDDLLKHNEPELKRLIENIRPFLFN